MSAHKVLYKLVLLETNTVSWFTDSDELYHIIEWYDDLEYKVYEYKLIEE